MNDSIENSDLNSTSIYQIYTIFVCSYNYYLLRFEAIKKLNTFTIPLIWFSQKEF